MKELQKSLDQQQLKELKCTLDPFKDEEDTVRCHILVVKKEIAKCNICHRHEGLPYHPQLSFPILK